MARKEHTEEYKQVLRERLAKARSVNPQNKQKVVAPVIQAPQRVLRTVADDIADFIAIRPKEPRFDCFKRLLRFYWPQFVNEDPTKGEVKWNPWMERILKTLCDDSTSHMHRGVRVKTTFLTGSAAAGKTHCVGLYAYMFFAMSPQNSIVMLTSTTKDMLKKRVWPLMQEFYGSAVDSRTGHRYQWPFNKVDSQTTIQHLDQWSESSDPKNAIFCMAVAHGETQKAAHNLRGLHDARMLLVIDEANGTPEAIFEAIPNQRKGCLNYEVVVIGNPISHLDPHGQCCKPAEGWGLVTEDILQWTTAGVDKWQIEPGVCLRFDGKQSPNVVTGEDKWPFIYTTADWARASNSKKEKTLAYWSQDRGLWPPDGFMPTVLSEALLEKYDPIGGDPFGWISRRRRIAALDPAFGGDDCKLVFAELGDITEGRDGIQITESVSITFEGASRDEIDYLIARQVIDACKLRGVEPECFGMDRTGTGRGVAAIIAAEWSNSIHQIEFGEMASERPSSTADRRPAREVYANRVTEMWFSVREFLEAGQLRGMPMEARVQFCTRQYQWRGRRYILEPKPDFKLRLGGSPDESDALSVLVDVVRQLGATPQTRNIEARDTAWDKVVDAKIAESEDEAALEARGQPETDKADPMGRYLITDVYESGMDEDEVGVF